jgi:hypothetical protein
LRAGPAAALLALGLSAGPAAAIDRSPMVMGPLYAEPARKPENPAPPSANGCQVQIVELRDTRRAPETLGAWATMRAIQAPPDREAWLRSVFEVGLAARGFNATVTPSGGGLTPGAVTARVRVQAIWISIVPGDQTGSVVIRMSAAAPSGAPGPEKVYRGDQIRAFWSSSQESFNDMTNRTFAAALDAMSADLRPLCSAGPAAPPTAAPVQH